MNASGIFFEVVEIYEARKKLPKCTDERFSLLTNISGEVDLRYFLCSEVPILQHSTVPHLLITKRSFLRFLSDKMHGGTVWGG